MGLKISRAVWALSVLLVFTPAFAWGPEGHQIIANIAASELSLKDKAVVRELLCGDAEESMVRAATWADESSSNRLNEMAL